MHIFAGITDNSGESGRKPKKTSPKRNTLRNLMLLRV